MKSNITIILTVFLVIFSAPVLYAGWYIDLEGGLAFNGYNDVRIPGNSGSDLSLSEDLKAESSQYYRIRLSMDLGKRHKLSLLAAPLTFQATGTVDRDVDFNGVRFSAQSPLNSTFRFDSYRLTYHYTLLSGNRLTAGIGFTGKIRDASIRIEDRFISSEKTNTGFVPLINFVVDWRFASKFGIIFEGDALAAPQGRAEDVLLAMYSETLDKVRFRLGYRILEGGADNDEVYTFTLVHYLSVGITYSM